MTEDPPGRREASDRAVRYALIGMQCGLIVPQDHDAIERRWGQFANDAGDPWSHVVPRLTQDQPRGARKELRIGAPLPNGMHPVWKVGVELVSEDVTKYDDRVRMHPVDPTLSDPSAIDGASPLWCTRSLDRMDVRLRRWR